jgi:hypothetical protein
MIISPSNNNNHHHHRCSSNSTTCNIIMNMNSTCSATNTNNTRMQLSYLVTGDCYANTYVCFNNCAVHEINYYAIIIVIITISSSGNDYYHTHSNDIIIEEWHHRQQQHESLELKQQEEEEDVAVSVPFWVLRKRRLLPSFENGGVVSFFHIAETGGEYIRSYLNNYSSSTINVRWMHDPDSAVQLQKEILMTLKQPSVNRKGSYNVLKKYGFDGAIKFRTCTFNGLT